MKFFIQILFILLAWFINHTHATPVFAKLIITNYKFAFSKAENVKAESFVKIGIQNFSRSSIEDENQFSKTSKGKVWASVALKNKESELVNNVGGLASSAPLDFVCWALC